MNDKWKNRGPQRWTATIDLPSPGFDESQKRMLPAQRLRYTIDPGEIGEIPREHRRSIQDIWCAAHTPKRPVADPLHVHPRARQGMCVDPDHRSHWEMIAGLGLNLERIEEDGEAAPAAPLAPALMPPVIQIVKAAAVVAARTEEDRLQARAAARAAQRGGQ